MTHRIILGIVAVYFRIRIEDGVEEGSSISDRAGLLTVVAPFRLGPVEARAPVN